MVSVLLLFLIMMTLKQLMATFPTDDSCREFLMERRWPTGVRCPRCGKSETVYKIKLAWKWECSNKECRKGHAYRFSIISGTIFENTKYPLKTWFEVVWQMLNSKKGVSALQIQRQIGCKSYETAWYMCMRLRGAMHDPDFRQLMGIVEVDETYIGGKNKTATGTRSRADAARSTRSLSSAQSLVRVAWSVRSSKIHPPRL
jgi:hypothetical protein